MYPGFGFKTRRIQGTPSQCASLVKTPKSSQLLFVVPREKYRFNCGAYHSESIIVVLKSWHIVEQLLDQCLGGILEILTLLKHVLVVSGGG